MVEVDNKLEDKLEEPLELLERALKSAKEKKRLTLFLRQIQASALDSLTNNLTSDDPLSSDNPLSSPLPSSPPPPPPPPPPR